MAILDAKGNDITAMVEQAAAAGGIPVLLLLGCMYGESGSLDQYSERWGTRTADAKAAIAAGRWGDLQSIINAVWADVSFGRAQRIVKFHYTGNLQPTVQNCMAVREWVFTHPEQDLVEMAKKLAGNLKTARQNDLSLFDGDEILAACATYNAGHLVTATEWGKYAPRIDNYRRGLATARAALEDHMGKIEEMAAAGQLIGGDIWKPDETGGVVDIQTSAGVARLAWLTDGIALEAPNGDVWQPVEGNPVSLARVVTNTMRARPDDFRAALAELGFQIVPG